MEFIKVHRYNSCEGLEYPYMVTKEVIIPIPSIVKIEPADRFCESSFSKEERMAFGIGMEGSYITTSQTDEYGKIISVFVCESPNTIVEIINKGNENRVLP